MKAYPNKAKILIPLILAALLGGCGKDLPEMPDSQGSDSALSAAVSDDSESKSRPELLPPDHRDNTAAGNADLSSGQSDSSSGQSDSSSGQPDLSSDQTGIALPSVSGALQVNGARLTDSNGQPIQLKGISTHGLAWFPGYVNEECFRQLREDWKANIIRLAMYTAENGGYCTGGDQKALKELVQNGVTYATAQDMYVIIDWHILSDGNPGTYLEQAKDFFGEMAELYASSDNVLYEICNEPNGGVSWSEIKAYAEEVISVIRSHDEDGVIIVGTPNWSQYVDQAAADPITDYDNIMYALHFYAATHKESLRNTMTAAIDAGLPVFVTEYGICDASGNGAIDESQANQWINTMNDYGVSYVAWNLSNKNDTSALFNSSCSKTSGFTKEDLSASGRWQYAMLTGQSSEDSSFRHENNPAPAPASTPGGGAQTSQGSTPPNPENGTQAAVCGDNDSLTCSVSLQNSWESDGKTYYQYELTLQNNTGSDCDCWAVDIPFNGSFSLSDGWNGDYTLNDKCLHIVNKDYNGSIPSDGSAGNIGFIVYGSSDLHIVD